MKNRRERSTIVFAELSFLTLIIFISGYLFVDLKEREAETTNSKNNLLMKKGVEFPRLDTKGSSAHVSGNSSIDIQIPKDGGKFIIEDKTVKREEVSKILEGFSGKDFNLLIDKKAPSEDTIFLLNLLSGFDSNINILHILEE